MYAPCKNCEDRVVHCHSTCDRYKEFMRLNEERKKAKPPYPYAGKHWRKRLPKQHDFHKTHKRKETNHGNN